jgi:hypothetical protein
LEDLDRGKEWSTSGCNARRASIEGCGDADRLDSLSEEILGSTSNFDDETGDTPDLDFLFSLSDIWG